MKQHFYVAMIYINWVLLAGFVTFFAIKGAWSLVIAWLVILPIAGWAYVHYFPYISKFVGYGSLDDQRATAVAAAPTEVTLYTAVGCPFCPVVKERLIALRQEMGFSLKEIDVTLRPNVLIAKGIRTLPVVECGTCRLEGNATSERLASLIAGSHSNEPILAR